MANGKWSMANGKAVRRPLLHLPFSIYHLPSMLIDHVNLVVQDLPGMTAFYRDVLGLKVTKEVTITGPWVAATVGLDDVHGDVVYLEFPTAPPGATRIELIRYNRPQLARPPNVDLPNAPGMRHLAFRVDDIDAAAARLHRAGVKLFSDVQSLLDGPETWTVG